MVHAAECLQRNSESALRVSKETSYETRVEPFWVAAFTEVGLSQKLVAEIGVSNFAFIAL
jgi:hypothetical protein